MARRSWVDQLTPAGPLPWWAYLVTVYPTGRMALEFGGYATRSEGWHQVGDAAVALVMGLASLFSLVVAVIVRRRPKVDS